MMAHAIVEWTDNLTDDGFEIRPLLQLIACHMREADGVFPWAGIRVRGIRHSDYVVADDVGEDAFINISVLIGPGRDDAFKQRYFSDLFEAVKAHLGRLFETRFLALSLYVQEASEAGSFKFNNIHPRFKGRG